MHLHKGRHSLTMGTCDCRAFLWATLPRSPHSPGSTDHSPLQTWYQKLWEIHQNQTRDQHFCVQPTLPTRTLSFLCWTAGDISRESLISYGSIGWNRTYKWLGSWLLTGPSWCLVRVLTFPAAGHYLTSLPSYLQETLMTQVALKSQSCFQIWVETRFNSFGKEGKRCSMTTKASAP